MIVGCSVTGVSSLALLRSVLRLEGAEQRILPAPLQPADGSLLDSCGALISDLAPWDTSAIESIERLRRQRPTLTIMLYLPNSPAVVGLLLNCEVLHGVFAHPQVNSYTAPLSLHNEVRRLLTGRAGTFVAELIRLVARESGPEAHDLVRVWTRAFREHSRDAFRVECLAKKLGLSQRSLQRKLENTQLPNPKEMLDWLAILYMSFLAFQEQRPLSHVAASIHIDRQRLYRLRRRLLLRDTKSKQSREALSVALLGFTKRCGLTDLRALEIVNYYLGTM